MFSHMGRLVYKDRMDFSGRHAFKLPYAHTPPSGDCTPGQKIRLAEAVLAIKPTAGGPSTVG